MLEMHQIEIKSNRLRGKKVISTLSYLNSRSLESQMISSAHIKEVNSAHSPSAINMERARNRKSKL